MAQIPKRTLEELAFYYRQAGPRNVDIFVEGPDDKLLLDAYVRERNARGCAVYTMDTIDFAGTDFRGLGLPAPSARSAVIALRKFLTDNGVDASQHLFLVDRDTEDLCATPLINGVQLTDSGALPVHLYDNSVEARLSALIYAGKIAPDTLKRSVTSICTEVYLMRAASKRLGLGLRILSSTDFVVGNGVDGFSFDLEGYLERCARSCGLYHEYDRIVATIDACRAELSASNLRKFALINDHTLWEVLRAIGLKLGSSNNRSSADIEELVRMTFDATQLSGHRLFRTIEEHVSTRGQQAA